MAALHYSNYTGFAQLQPIKHNLSYLSVLLVILEYESFPRHARKISSFSGDNRDAIV